MIVNCTPGDAIGLGFYRAIGSSGICKLADYFRGEAYQLTQLQLVNCKIQSIRGTGGDAVKATQTDSSQTTLSF